MEGEVDEKDSKSQDVVLADHPEGHLASTVANAGTLPKKKKQKLSIDCIDRLVQLIFIRKSNTLEWGIITGVLEFLGDHAMHKYMHLVIWRRVSTYTNYAQPANYAQPLHHPVLRLSSAPPINKHYNRAWVWMPRVNTIDEQLNSAPLTIRMGLIYSQIARVMDAIVLTGLQNIA